MRHVHDLLDAYYDGELASRGRRQVEVHLRDCPTCQAEWARLSRLSALLSEYTLPDAVTRAEVFRAQVALRLSRRVVESSGYGEWAWHLVPLILLCGLILLHTLFVLFGALGVIVRFVAWLVPSIAEGLGIDVGSLLGWFGLASAEPWAALGSMPMSTMAVLNVALLVCLYLGLLLIFVPYAGWVGALWHTTRVGRARPRM